MKAEEDMWLQEDKVLHMVQEAHTVIFVVFI